MNPENEGALTPEFLRRQLRGIANLELSEEGAGMFELLVGLVSMMNTLQPEGYAGVFPALTFRPIKE